MVAGVCLEITDRPDVSRQVMRTARKPHRCCECRDAIEVGQRYEVFTGRWGGGRWQTFKTCEICVRIRDDLFPCGYLLEGLDDLLQEYFNVRLCEVPEDEDADR